MNVYDVSAGIKMLSSKLSLILVIPYLLVMASCTGAPEDNDIEQDYTINSETVTASEEKIAAIIEEKVKSKNPDIILDDYARFYAHRIDNKVMAFYSLGDEDIGSKKRKAGQSYWVSVDNIPFVLDGGCGYITVIYNKSSEELDSIECNGDA